jgi:hypothetical protein
VIREEAERTRAELSSDVDALTDKVNPRRMATARVERVRGRLAQIRDKVMGSATHGRDTAGQHPAEPAGATPRRAGEAQGDGTLR